MASGPITLWQTDGKTMETVTDFIFLGSKITADGDCSHEIKRRLLLGRKAMTNLRSILKSRDITLSTKFRLVKAMVFPVVMWELDHKESWAPKNWCFWTVVLEKTLESPLDCKEIQPVNPKGNQSWIFIGRTDAEAQVPTLWPPDAKNWLTGKDSDAGKDRRQEEKGMTEDEMVRWHHWLNEDEIEQALGIGDGQGSLVCCSSWAHKESDTTEWLNWTEVLQGLEVLMTFHSTWNFLPDLQVFHWVQARPSPISLVKSPASSIPTMHTADSPNGVIVSPVLFHVYQTFSIILLGCSTCPCTDIFCNASQEVQSNSWRSGERLRGHFGKGRRSLRWIMVWTCQVCIQSPSHPSPQPMKHPDLCLVCPQSQGPLMN